MTKIQSRIGESKDAAPKHQFAAIDDGDAPRFHAS
jgi:hypothetical protein